MSVLKVFASLLLLGFSWTGYAQQAPLEVVVHGNRATVEVDLGGIVSADLTLNFENAVGLTPENLGISAEMIDVGDLSLLNRLPSPTTGLSSAFPLMITIEPPADGGFAFSGLVSVDIHTHNLEYVPGTPLRFFKAPLGGEFRDITMTMGKGSYRARGTTGKFSQFIIALDLRPVTEVISTKFSHLSLRLNDFSSSIDSQVLGVLSGLVSQIDTSISQGNYIVASRKVGKFIQALEQASATQVPNVWRSSRDIDNVSGELLALANTLRFSLRLAN